MQRYHIFDSSFVKCHLSLMLLVKVSQDDPQVAVAPLATQIAVHWVSVTEINQELLGKGGQA